MNNVPGPSIGFDNITPDQQKQLVYDLLHAFENCSFQQKEATWDQLREKYNELAPYQPEVLRHTAQFCNICHMLKDFSTSGEGFRQSGLTFTGKHFQVAHQFLRYYILMRFFAFIGGVWVLREIFRIVGEFF